MIKAMAMLGLGHRLIDCEMGFLLAFVSPFSG